MKEMLFCVLEINDHSLICMTTKETWEKEGYLDDTSTAYGDEVNELLENLGLYEDMGGIYPVSDGKDASDIVHKLEDAGFTYNEALGKMDWSDLEDMYEEEED